MIFRQFYYDSQPIRPDGKMTFFSESDESETSIVSFGEDEAVKWLFGIHHLRHEIIREFFINPDSVQAHFGLQYPFTSQNKKPGDIDLLLVDKVRPDQGIAFECKRVKITSQERGYSKINNAGAIKRGIEQANGLQSIGFYQSYLLIILLDDSRKLLDYPNTMMRNSSFNSVEEIYDIPWNEPLNSDVGVVFIKVTQPTGKHYGLMAGIGICIDKDANKLEQTNSMTNRIREVIANKN